METRLTKKAERDMDERFRLQYEALGIFKLVVAEWKSDPQSVQCFDLRIVAKAIDIDQRMRKVNPLY